MKLIKNIYIFIVTGFIASCTMVDFPDPVEQTPVFFAKGTIDGKAVNWTAGENGYYMHTQIEKGSGDNIGRPSCKRRMSRFVPAKFTTQHGIRFTDTAKFSFDF
ncbi:MAG: hypothetical protein IPL23_20835 [Saprospiraceae bacterium]|nr:hypothetical protein [Saprospiraceae bacterium]